jgi:integrase
MERPTEVPEIDHLPWLIGTQMLHDCGTRASELGLKTLMTDSVKDALREIETERQESKRSLASSTILSCCLEYLADRQITGRISDKTARENMAIFELITQIIGDKPVGEITYEDMVAARATLLKLPPNLHKSPAWRGLSIGQVLQLKPKRTLSLRSVNKYLNRFSSFLNWCLKRRLIQVNPFQGSQIRDKNPASQARLAFTPEDLRRLLAPSRFCFPAEERWRGVIILLALTTGMRLEEICQLRCDDLVQIDGIHCIDINEDTDDKRLKNTASRRVIPVPSVLIERFAFLEFVDQQRSLGVRLFPALRKIDGCYGHAYSKWFRVYRERCGVTDPGKAFHSFRHTVATRFKSLDVPLYVAAEILGHTVPGMTYGHYGKATSVHKMAAALERLDCAEMLSHVSLR